LTSEQLSATRATLWRQKAEPLLTLDDAQAWLEQSGLCLFLPRKAQIPAPAPSFVEACLGETNATPPRAAIETAKGLLVRLIEANSALPLNLLGAATDLPDFLVSIEALPFVYALRGDRDWKHAPGTAGANRVSPLVTQVWKLLEKRGVLTAIEIQEDLGRELTEAAVLRALHELWSSLRVVPLYQAGGQDTLWEPLQSRHQKAMTAGVAMSQITALSVLVSVYLQSVIAASGDDAETFLSPLASRAKVREVVRGLSATRQLSMIQMETQSLLYVEGSLPEFPEAEKPETPTPDAARPIRRAHPTSPEGMAAALARKAAGSVARPAYKRPATSPDSGSPAGPPARTFSRPPARTGGSLFRPAAGGARPAFRPPAFRPKTAPAERSEPGTGLRADGTPKKTRWRDLPGGRPDQKGKPARFGPRKTEGETGGGNEAVRPSAPRREAGTFRPAAGVKPAYRPADGSRPPFKSSLREGKPYRPTGASRPSGSFRPQPGSSRPDRPSYDRPDDRPRPDRPNNGGAGRPSRPYNAERPPYRPAAARPEGGSRPPARTGDSRFTPRPEGSRPFFRPRRDDASPAGRTPREGGESGGDRKFTPKFKPKFTSGPPRAGGFSSSRPPSGASRPYTPRPGGPPGPGKPSYGKPAGGRPAFGSTPYRGSSSPGRPSFGGKFSGKPGAGKPGSGFKPDYKPRGAKPGPGSRPGFGQGPRPGAGRTGSPAGRPPAKFKKRPESAE